MSAIPSASHRFREFFGADASRILRVTFRDGDILRFHSFCIVDPSIYSISDQWTATVVEQVAGSHRHFHPGAGVESVETDIIEIFDESSGKIVYKGEHVV